MCAGLPSPVMAGQGEPGVDPAGLVVPLAGQLVATGDRWEPYRLVDPHGAVVAAAGAYFFHLQAAGRAEATVRSYGMDLLRWFRFLWAARVAWDQAGPVRCPGFLPVAAAGRQAGAAALAGPGPAGAGCRGYTGRGVCAVGACA